MPGRKRRIHFFEPILIDAKGVVQTFDESFWESLHERVQMLADHEDPAQRNRLRKDHTSFRYSGSARTEASPIAKYFYIGKVRPESDWPDMENRNSQTTSLELSDPEASLVEPAYLLPVSGTSYVAILRTSGGPTWSAIESWIKSVTGYDQGSSSFELRPYVRKDQLRRLAQARGISKLHLKVEPESSGLIDANAGQLAGALNSVLELGAGGVSVEVGLSFGHSRPDEAAAYDIAREVERLLKNVEFSQASATLLVEDDDAQKLQKESVDFYRDRVSMTELVGNGQDELPTPPVVLKAMYEAISNFKKSLNKLR